MGRKITVRDALLAVQIALCAVLVTSSIVAVRGLVRSLHGNFGFEPQNSMLVGADLHLAGYGSNQVPAMQKRMLDAVASIPGVESVGLTDGLLLNDSNSSIVFTDRTTDLRPSNAASDAYTFHVSPEYLRAEGTSLLSGRDFTWHDDMNSPRVAVVNREFARRIFGPHPMQSAVITSCRTELESKWLELHKTASTAGSPKTHTRRCFSPSSNGSAIRRGW